MYFHIKIKVQQSHKIRKKPSKIGKKKQKKLQTQKKGREGMKMYQVKRFDWKINE